MADGDEKLEKAKKEAAEAEGEDAKAEHEVTHTDELTADVDVKKVTGSQRRLWGLVMVAVVLLGTGGVGFYSQLESGDIGLSAGSGNRVVRDTGEKEESDVPKGTFVYVAKAGQSSILIKKIDHEESESSELGASVSNDSNRHFQISSNSLVRATQASSGIVINSLSDENQTLLSDQAQAITDWVLTPDGTRVYALVAGALYEADTDTGDSEKVSDSFVAKGNLKSRLYFSRDGTVRHYGKSGSVLYASILDIKTKETVETERDVIRFDRIADFNPESLSPDGTSLVFRATINGNETMQLMSLNSYVLRTVYVADDSGTFPQSFTWSQDSNNIIINVGGSLSKLIELKVGTLQKEIILQNSGPYINPQWSPNKQDVSFVQNDTLKRVNLESKEVTELLDSVSETDITGWFAN